MYHICIYTYTLTVLANERPSVFVIHFFIRWQVTSVHSTQKPFIIRMRSEDFERVQAKLHATIRNAKNVVILQSVSDRFLQVWSV